MRGIISRAESLRILKIQLRKAALAKRAAELKDATAEKRATILAEIERDIEKQVQQRDWLPDFGPIIH